MTATVMVMRTVAVMYGAFQLCPFFDRFDVCREEEVKGSYDGETSTHNGPPLAY